MTQVLEVSTATPSRDVALALAASAVRAGLAAGGQVSGPLTSVFWHGGQFGEGEEWKVSLRTTDQRYPELESHLIEHHVWDNPEVTAVAFAAASAGYVSWIERTTAT